METGNISDAIRSCIIPPIETLEKQVLAVYQSQTQIKAAIDRLAAESQVVGTLLDYPEILGATLRLSAQKKRLIALQMRILKINNKLKKHFL